MRQHDQTCPPEDRLEQMFRQTDTSLSHPRRAHKPPEAAMPDAETCWLCLAAIPVDEYDAHLARHMDAGRLWVLVEDGEATPVFSEGLESRIDLTTLPGLRAEQRETLRQLAVQSVQAVGGTLDETGRYPPSKTLRALINRHLPGFA